MEESNLDKLVESVEVLTTDINKVSFEIEGLREDYDRMEDKQPFMVRQMNSNLLKTNRLIKTLNILTHEKQHVDTELGAAQMELAAKTKPKDNKPVKKKVTKKKRDLVTEQVNEELKSK